MARGVKKMLGWPDFLYEKGIAHGDPDIREDAVFFRFREECYVVPTVQACEIWDCRGSNIYAKRSDIRKLVKKGLAERWQKKE